MNTFNDWHKGKVTLDCTNYCKENKDDNIIIVAYSDFNEDDQQRIKNTQKEYFHQIVHDETNRLIDTFITRYNRSEFKIDLLNNEVKQLYNILFLEVPSVLYISLEHWDISISNERLERFKELYKRHKINGYEVDYSSQNSLFSPYNCKSQSPEVQFETYYEYYNFLNGVIIDAECVYNPSDWNEKCFKFFKLLEEEYQLKNGKPKYILFFHFLHEMTQKESSGIEFNFKQKNYIRFITDNYFDTFDKPNPPKMNKSSYYERNSKPLREMFKAYNK